MIFPRLKEIREDNDKSQRQIAEFLFTSAFQYGRWERGDNEVPVSVLIFLADFYNVSLDWLTGRTNKKDVNR